MLPLNTLVNTFFAFKAWVRIALNDSLLESYVSAMLRDVTTLRKFYRRTAFLRDCEQSDILLSLLQGW